MRLLQPRLSRLTWVVFVALLSLAFSFSGMVSAAASEPEARALWVRRSDMYSRGNIDNLLSFSKALGVNMLIVQVTSGGSTVTQSELLPLASQVPPGFDPLAYLIEEARPLGIEIHAWVNAFVQSGFTRLPDGPQYAVNRHPEWVTYDVNGRSLLEMVGLLADHIPADLPGLMLEPTLPGVREYLTAHVAEIVSRYDVDGIHLDYIRYAGRNYGYNPESRADFKGAYGFDPLDFAPPNVVAFRNEHGLQLTAQLERAWDDYRRNGVTQAVIDVYEAVAEIKPWVVVSVAAARRQAEAFQHRFQDWDKWLREGIVDLAIPMAYGTDPLVHRGQIELAVRSAQAGERHVLAGVASYNIQDDRETFLAILENTRDLGAQGFALFSYQSIVGHLQTFLLVRDTFGEGPVPPVPPMPWKVPRPQ